MARLPQPGGDSGNWGTILNDYLNQSHQPNGTLKEDSVGVAQIQDDAVTAAAIADNTITETLLDSTVQSKLNATTSNSVVAGYVSSAGDTQTAIDARIQTIGDSRYTPAGSNTLNGYDTGQNFVVKNDTKYGISNIYVASDSTGAVSTRWPWQWLNRMASDNSDAMVGIRTWNDATKTLNTETVLQAGTIPTVGIVTSDNFNRTGDVYQSTPDIGNTWGGFSNSAGDWICDGSKAVRSNDTTSSELITNSGVTGNRIVRITGVTISTVGQATAQSFRVITKRVASNVMLYGYLNVSTTGQVTWGVSKNISGTTSTVVSGTANPITANTANISTNITLSVSGTSVSFTVGAQTINGTLTSSDVTALENGATDGFTNGPLGAMSMDKFEVEVTTPGAISRQIHMYNGALTGSTLAYQTTWLAQQCPVTPEIVLINSCHNYGSQTSAQYLTALDDFLELVRTTWPTAGVVIMSQNPQKAPAPNQDAHLLRLQAIRSWATKNGVGYIPVIEAFRSLPNYGTTYIRSDGVHPTDATDTADPNNGAYVWTQAVYSYFSSMSLAP